MVKSSVGLGLFLFASVVSAYQRVPVLEGHEVNANISAEGLNRIAVEDDKIVSVKGTTGEFSLDKDDALGQIYIKPETKDKPIHVYVSTEKGNTYSLNLTSSEISPESIVLIPEQKIEHPFEQTASYEDSLKEVVKAMHNQAFDGYSVDKAKVKLPKVRDVHVTHLQSYLGSKVSGEILEVSNTSSEDMLLSEAEFYFEDVRAVAIVDKILPAKSKTRVYLVRG